MERKYSRPGSPSENIDSKFMEQNYIFLCNFALNMRESLELTQQQRLQQRLHPEQMLYGRLLEMSTPEIEDEVRRVVDENPALIEKNSPPDEHNAEDGSFNESAEELQRADYASDDDVPFYRTHQSSSYFEPEYETPAAAPGQTLAETLKTQLADYSLDSLQRAVAEYVVDNLDDNGYLTRSPAAMADDMSAQTGFEVNKEMFANALQLIRRMEPAGVGAVDLRDCMLLQLDRLKDTPDVLLARQIVKDHFDAFSKRHAERLMASLGVDQQQLGRAISIITALDPKPGAHADSSGDNAARYIVPDFNVEVDSSGRATVALTGRTPELAIEESFVPDESKLDDSPRQRDAYAFIRARHDEAQSFIKILNARARTLMDVMKAIVHRQHEFFATADPAAIRPMILRDIAADTGLDLSVISRATAGKYVATPAGVYPVKMFFNERPTEASDAGVHAISQRIKNLIAGEDKQAPLSDEALRAMLASEGYDIARRTVSKYREKLGLPVARLRKKF